ncbi:DUF2061 domain-containing protein [Ideonella sp.]|uniref:DUF2061 domain-containing protein n=1 Tax=Ideonella sp. TaxID=1929293 RepID=UPI003BB58372
MAKSASFGVMHLGIAFAVSYALSGSLAVAGAITVVEPICNTVAHYFFDGWWERRKLRQAAAALASGSERPGQGQSVGARLGAGMAAILEDAAPAASMVQFHRLGLQGA